MTRFMMGALQGLSAGFLICAIIEPDALGLALFVAGGLLQIVYWGVKIKREKRNG